MRPARCAAVVWVDYLIRRWCRYLVLVGRNAHVSGSEGNCTQDQHGRISHCGEKNGERKLVGEDPPNCGTRCFCFAVISVESKRELPFMLCCAERALQRSGAATVLVNRAGSLLMCPLLLDTFSCRLLGALSLLPFSLRQPSLRTSHARVSHHVYDQFPSLCKHLALSLLPSHELSVLQDTVI